MTARDVAMQDCWAAIDCPYSKERDQICEAAVTGGARLDGPERTEVSLLGTNSVWKGERRDDKSSEPHSPSASETADHCRKCRDIAGARRDREQSRDSTMDHGAWTMVHLCDTPDCKFLASEQKVRYRPSAGTDLGTPMVAWPPSSGIARLSTTPT